MSHQPHSPDLPPSDYHYSESLIERQEAVNSIAKKMSWKLCIQGYDRNPKCFFTGSIKKVTNSSLNVFDDGAVLLGSVIWTLSIVLMFFNHNVSRDGSSLVNK
jgi:hypothetical protein